MIVGVLVVGILAIVTIAPMVFSSQSQPVATATESQLSYYFTTTTTVGDVTMTMVLVNTSALNRPANPPPQSSALDLAPLGQFAFLLLAAALMLGLWSSHRP